MFAMSMIFFFWSINFHMTHQIKEHNNSSFTPNSVSESSGCFGCEHLGSLLLSAANFLGLKLLGWLYSHV